MSSTISTISAGGGGGSSGIFRVSSAGTLVGIEPPEASRNIEIKPYAIGSLTRDTVSNPEGGNVRDGDFGLDVKYGITRNLTADLTYNTDLFDRATMERFSEHFERLLTAIVANPTRFSIVEVNELLLED